jgi:hypothetical protein
MTEELRSRDETIPITLCMDEGDLSRDGALRPQDASEHLDFLSMQAAPFSSDLASGPGDVRLPPFLGRLTQWLGGRDVLISGFGIPTEPAPEPGWDYKRTAAARLVSEEEAAAFFSSVLEQVLRAGMIGALVSFFSDFDPALWGIPPLDEDLPGRHLGVFRHDGGPKDFQPLLRQHSALQRLPFPGEPPSWIDISKEEYEEDPKQHIRRLYGNYRDHYADS